MVTGISNAGNASVQTDAQFLTSAAAKLGIDGGQVSASFTDKGESFTLTGEVKDKFDYEGSNEASTNLEVSTSYGDNSTFFVSANSTSKNGDVSDKYTAGAKYSSDVDGKKRTGQLTVSNKDGDTSYQAKGSLVDALTDDATLSINMQFDYAGEEVAVKNSAKLDLTFDDSSIDSLTIGEFMDTEKGSGFTLSADEKFSDKLTGSANVGVFDNGSSIASVGVTYAASEDTSLYANVSSFEQEGVDTSYGAQAGVKTKFNDSLALEVGGYSGDYTEFKDASAPKPHDEGVYANLSWKF